MFDIKDLCRLSVGFVVLSVLSGGFEVLAATGLRVFSCDNERGGYTRSRTSRERGGYLWFNFWREDCNSILLSTGFCF